MSTTDAMVPLLALRDALATVAGVATCKVGIEANMTAADYPMVRVVPSKAKRAAVMGRRRVEVLVYFGEPLHEFTAGLESLYAQVFELEAAILTKAESGGDFIFDYIETIADEDRVDGYKLMAIRGVVEG